METRVIIDRAHWQTLTDKLSRQGGNTKVLISVYNDDEQVGVIVYKYIAPNN